MQWNLCHSVPDGVFQRQTEVGTRRGPRRGASTYLCAYTSLLGWIGIRYKAPCCSLRVQQALHLSNFLAEQPL